MKSDEVRTVAIYGRSDDLVEVEGDVPGCDEYGSFNTPTWIELSTGTTFKVEYTTRGVWTVEQVTVGGAKALGLKIEKTPHGDGDDPEPHTDTVKITGPIEWVEAWTSWPVTDGDIRRRVEDVFEEDYRNRRSAFNADDYRKFWAVIAAAKRRRTTA